MTRNTAVAAATLLGLGLMLGIRAVDPAMADPARTAELRALVRARVAEADVALASAESAFREATDLARAGQAAILAGDQDPADSFAAALAAFEAAAGPLTDAEAALERLGWALYALDPGGGAPPPNLPLLTVSPDEAVAIGSQWLAAAIPASALADLRQAAAETLDALDDALRALESDDIAGATAALDRAEDALGMVRELGGPLDRTTFDYWMATVEDLQAATRRIADAAAAGDAAALAGAQAAYATAAEDAVRADQALVIALGERAAALTRGASASAADALRAVVAARDALAALSILP